MLIELIFGADKMPILYDFDNFLKNELKSEM